MTGKTICLVLETCLVYSTTQRKGAFVSLCGLVLHDLSSKAGRFAERSDVRLIRNSFINKELRRGREYTTQHLNADFQSLSPRYWVGRYEGSVEPVRLQFYARGVASPC